jgi:hypothetical protein
MTEKNNKEHLYSIEKRLWSNDPEFYRENLHEDVILLFTDKGRIDRDTAVEAIKGEVKENRVWEEVIFEDQQHKELSENVVLLTYMVKAKWNYSPDRLQLMCSSIYQKRNDRWKLAFHQQTGLK